jgi:hypothetical protein
LIGDWDRSQSRAEQSRAEKIKRHTRIADGEEDEVLGGFEWSFVCVGWRTGVAGVGVEYV